MEGQEVRLEDKIKAEGLEQAILTIRAGAGRTNELTCLWK
jgi:hypothetical protein